MIAGVEVKPTGSGIFIAGVTSTPAMTGETSTTMLSFFAARSALAERVTAGIKPVSSRLTKSNAS